MMYAATERDWETVAPATVGAGAARSLRWLRQLAALWARGWVGYARAVGAEPEHLLGPNPWLARRRGAPAGLAGSSVEEPWVEDDGGQVIRGVLGDENWVRMIRPAAGSGARRSG